MVEFGQLPRTVRDRKLQLFDGRVPSAKGVTQAGCFGPTRMELAVRFRRLVPRTMVVEQEEEVEGRLSA